MSSGETMIYLTEEYMKRLDELSESIQSGKREDAHRLIGELTTLRESSLFQELGKLTREIHDSIASFSDDERMARLTKEEIPDAKERLNYIITKTDDAAHRTMTGTEAVMEVVDDLNQQASNIADRWKQFRSRELSKADFLAMGEDMDHFLSSIDTQSQQVKGSLTDIMMAQDYQDLTGQMIRQVINMVQEVEERLVRLVAISGASLGEHQEMDDGNMAHGPQLPSADKQEVATNQDEVDDLLASLGF